MTAESSQAKTADTHDARQRIFTEDEIRHRSFIENNVDGAWRLDLEAPIPLDLPVMEQVELLYRHGYFGEANQALADQYGFSTPAEIIGFRLEAFMPRDLPTAIPRLIQAAELNYHLNAWESFEQDRFGNRKVFLNNMTGEIVDGKLQRVWGTAKDITRQKQIEEESRLRSEVFDQIPDGCVIVEVVSEKVVYLNAAFTRITGYTVSDISGEKLSFLQGAYTDPGMVAKLREAIAHERAFLGEILNYKKDGTPFWNLMRISPIRDTAGVVTHYVGILSDITERKRRDEELQEQRIQLAHVTRVAAMGELTAALAHELNQPLTAILSNAQAAQRFLDQGAPDVDEARDILVDIIADDKRASAVMRRIRGFIKPSGNRFESLDINDVVEEVRALLRKDMSVKQVTCSAGLTPDLPAVYGDPVQLRQVILNLLMNACQAMKDMDSTKRRIMVATRSLDDQAVEIAVTDTGPGIDVSVLDKIFQPFFTTKQDGMGMGLAINRSIVEAHGGRLWAESSPGQGAVFYVTLPVPQ